jgi:hypothetical protein
VPSIPESRTTLRCALQKEKRPRLLGAVEENLTCSSYFFFFGAAFFLAGAFFFVAFFID